MATYYWVGGTGTWDGSTTTNWALTSGGAGGAGVPNNTDTAIFDANSGTAAVVNVASTAVSLSTTIDKSDINLSFSGSPTLCTAAGILTLTSGTITLNTNTVTVGRFASSNTNVRSIAFGTGAINLTNFGAVIWNTGTNTNFSFTGTPKINATYAGATGTRILSNTVLGLNASVVSGTDSVQISGGGGVWTNLDFTGFSGTLTNQAVTIYGNLTLSSTMSLSAGTGVITFAATSGAQQITTNGVAIDRPITQNSPGATLQLQDNLTMGSTRTFTLTAGTLDLNNRTLTSGLFNSNNSNVRTLAFGSGKIVVSGNNTGVLSFNAVNLTVSGSRRVEFSYVGAIGTRTIGLMATVDEATALDFYILGGTDIVTTTGNLRGARNLDFTGFAGTYTLNPTVAVGIYGDLTFSAGMTLSAANVGIEFRKSSGTQTITTNGKTLDFPIGFNASGSIAFQDALTQGSTRAFTITNGTVQLKNGVTSTIGAFTTSGTNQKFLQSTTLGSQATLSQASGTVTAQYLTIRDINATGGATWNAFVDQGNIDAGNNDGWDFGISPIVGGNEYTYQLRSFTQPRRF